MVLRKCLELDSSILRLGYIIITHSTFEQLIILTIHSYYSKTFFNLIVKMINYLSLKSFNDCIYFDRQFQQIILTKKFTFNAPTCDLFNCFF